ncbi:hypothetical protein OG455_04165 [Kitasatospora sp. NBC_01287]|uniref:hypothetical protein n=1 Tax=Kitasatospora sp. NBC_01287 TaxID=2903573 RepID=UPI0022563689|nr:hypothetical protein [Kitasatospora sp. NBC_01287]MCX4744724.1 hypothetical protein [Kitasatospora sp. NBC_01287]
MPFTTATDEFAERARPHATGALRIVAALLFSCHGAALLFDVLGGAHGGSVRSASGRAGGLAGWRAALIQLVGGALVLRLDHAPRSVRLQPEGRELPWQYDGTYLQRAGDRPRRARHARGRPRLTLPDQRTSPVGVGISVPG